MLNQEKMLMLKYISFIIFLKNGWNACKAGKLLCYMMHCGHSTNVHLQNSLNAAGEQQTCDFLSCVGFHSTILGHRTLDYLWFQTGQSRVLHIFLELSFRTGSNVSRCVECALFTLQDRIFKSFLEYLLEQIHCFTKQGIDG